MYCCWEVPRKVVDGKAPVGKTDDQQGCPRNSTRMGEGSCYQLVCSTAAIAILVGKNCLGLKQEALFRIICFPEEVV
jgi:hypothetical protein